MIPHSINLPPVIERELRLTARRRSTYWDRVGAAGIGIIVFFGVMNFQLAIGSAQQAGRMTFSILAGVAGFAAVRRALASASAAFAREKREDTLGFLFLTPLRPVDLVAGKLVSSSLSAFYQFVAFIPLLGLPMLAGGVTAGQFLMLVLALANLVFFTATLGLNVSARAWDERRAASVAVSWLVALTILLPMFGWVISRNWWWQPTGNYLLSFSPIFPVWLATNLAPGQALLFWASLALTHALGWLLFRGACRILPVCWRSRPTDEASRARGSGGESAVESPRTGGAGGSHRPEALGAARPPRMVRRQFDAVQRAQSLERNPVFWLASRWRARTSTPWIIGSVALAGVVVTLLTGPVRTLLEPGFVLFAAFFVNAAFKLHVATQCSMALARDRVEDTLELLLATPLTPRELVQGHLQAILPPLRRWVRWVIGVEAVWMVIALAVNPPGQSSAHLACAGILAGMLALFIADLRAVGWESLWQGLLEKDARTAAGRAVARVLALPWAVAVVAIVPCSVLRLGTQTSFLIALGAFIVTSALADRGFSRRARRRLYADLPVWATRRAAGEFEHYDGWRRAGRWVGRWWRRLFHPARLQP